MKKIKLICFSYAGGTSAFYNNWKNVLDHSIEIHPIELPGRGTRFVEPCCETIDGMVNDVFEKVRQKSEMTEYAFWGHSMGTIIINELVNKIKLLQYPEPSHIFLSGRFPPHFKEKKILHKLSDEEFKNEISNLGGTPKEILENNDLFNIFIPILRADYKAIETYEYSLNHDKWNSDISVLYGTDDTETNEYDYSEWRHYTNGALNLYELTGGHFFIHDNVDNIVSIINKTLKKELNTLEEFDR